MGANHSHVTIYMVQNMAPKASFSTLCAHNGTLVHVPSKKFLHKIIGQDGQDLAQDLGQDLRQDPGSQSWYLGQDLGQVLGKLGQVLGKISCPRTFCWKLINCAPRMASFPRCAPTMASLSMLCAHNGCPRCAPTMAMHPCAPTMAVHVVRPHRLSTLCAHNGCPRCAPTMAPMSTLCVAPLSCCAPA